jgi:DnaJ family protein C protein 7
LRPGFFIPFLTLLLLVTTDYERAVGRYTLAIGSARAEIFKHQNKGKLNIMLSSYYASRAAAFTKLKQYDQALEDCKFALEFDRNSIKAYKRKARIYMQKGRLDEAVETYDKATKIDPEAVASDRKHTELTKRKFDNARAIIVKQRSKTYGENISAIQNAKEDLKTVLKFCPDWAEPRILETEAVFYAGDTDEALQMASDLVKNGLSRDLDLLILRTRLLLNKGRLDDAIKQLGVLTALPTGRAITGRAITSLSEKTELIRQLVEQGEGCYAKKDYPRAIRYYSTAIDTCPDEAQGMVAKLKFNRSAAYASVGAHKKAIEDYSAILKYEPSHVKTYIRQGTSFAALKAGDRIQNCQDAVNSFEIALDLRPPAPLEDEIKKKLNEALSELTKAKLVTKDHFAVLGLRTSAKLGEIHNAYRMRSVGLHNFRRAAKTSYEVAEAERQYQEVSEAYQVLSEACKGGCMYQLVDTVLADTEDTRLVRRSDHGRCDYDPRLVRRQSDPTGRARRVEDYPHATEIRMRGESLEGDRRQSHPIGRARRFEDYPRTTEIRIGGKSPQGLEDSCIGTRGASPGGSSSRGASHRKINDTRRASYNEPSHSRSNPRLGNHRNINGIKGASHSGSSHSLRNDTCLVPGHGSLVQQRHGHEYGNLVQRPPEHGYASQFKI